MTLPTDGSGDLRRLAVETDGGEIAADAEPAPPHHPDSSAYYLLSFRTSHPDDGQFRELQARVKRPGAVVRARKGYWTASPDEALRVAILAKANEPKVVVPLEPAPHASPLIHPWFGVSRGENGKTRVTFVWEPAAHVPGDRVRRTVSRIEFQAKLSDGTVLYEGPVAPTGPGVIDSRRRRRLASCSTSRRTAALAHVDPGHGVDGDGSGRARDVDPRPEGRRGDRHAAICARAASAIFARSTTRRRCVSSREFNRAERLLIRFRAYGPAGSANSDHWCP